MRKVKFKAWDEELEKMYCGDEIEARDDINAWLSYGELAIYRITDGEYIELKPLQFTGLTDVHGNEIYEGDILDYRYVVTYVDGSDGADLGMNIGFYEQRDNFESWLQLEAGRETEIKGNIYENPELLNK